MTPSSAPRDEVFDIAVVGGGAAGIMAAIRAAGTGKTVLLIERNESIGKKILITGKGRCNITNSASIDAFIEKFGSGGKFLRTAFFRFFNSDIVEFFSARGLEMKIERQGRVFPVTDKARSVVEALKACIDESDVKVLYGSRIKSVRPVNGAFHLELEDSGTVRSDKVILAMGGASYSSTGSTGDGFDIAAKLGHTIVPLRPGLVPLTVKESWVKGLQGLSLENVSISFDCGGKPLVSEVGEMIFTHFGVSGPLVLDLSGDVIRRMEDKPAAHMSIDLKPALTAEQLEKRLLAEIKSSGKAALKSMLKGYLPQKLIAVFLELAGIDASKEANQMTQVQRRSIIKLFKALPLTVTGALPIEEAMVTGGGVSTKEINPRTMESRLVPGLYFAGEMIDGCAASGGYNLQQAFSTGYLAGESAAG